MEIMDITEEVLKDLFKPESLADKELAGITDEILKELFTQDSASVKVSEEIKADATINAFSGTAVLSVVTAKEVRLVEKLEALCESPSDAFVLRLFNVFLQGADRRDLSSGACLRSK